MVASRSNYRLKDGTKVTKRYYSCGKFRSQGSLVCKANSVDAECTEQCVLSRINELLARPKVLRDMVKAVNAKRQSEHRTDGV